MKQKHNRAVKVVRREKFIVKNTYIQKKKKNNKELRQPNFTPQELEKDKLSPKLAERRK